MYSVWSWAILVHISLYDNCLLRVAVIGSGTVCCHHLLQQTRLQKSFSAAAVCCSGCFLQWSFSAAAVCCSGRLLQRSSAAAVVFCRIWVLSRLLLTCTASFFSCLPVVLSLLWGSEFLCSMTNASHLSSFLLTQLLSLTAICQPHWTAHHQLTVHIYLQ